MRGKVGSKTLHQDRRRSIKPCMHLQSQTSILKNFRCTFLKLSTLCHLRFDLDLWLGNTCQINLGLRIWYTFVTASDSKKLACCRHQVCKNGFEGDTCFYQWTARKLNCLYIYCCSNPAIKWKPFYFCTVHLSINEWGLRGIPRGPWNWNMRGHRCNESNMWHQLK